MKLRNGIMQVLLANILNLIISTGNGFLLPKFLSTHTYAEIKTFLLYVSYAGVLHLGYIDGIYLKYGGKETREICREELNKEKWALAVFQAVISAMVILPAWMMKDEMLFYAACSIFPLNMVAFYRYIYQATGEFREYRWITNIQSLLIFLFHMFFLFVLRKDASVYYILTQVGISFCLWLYYEKKGRMIWGGGRSEQRKTGEIISRWQVLLRSVPGCMKYNICTGIVIMLGNFMGIWITSIDRWFVKFFGSVREFALYSFAVTMLKLIHVVITAFSVTLYNYFCKDPSETVVRRIRVMVLSAGAGVIASIYPLCLLIRYYLPDYAEAIPLIRIIFASQLVMIPVNAVYLNLYKSFRMQRQYLIQMAVVTGIAFASNLVIGAAAGYTMASFAAGTFVTAVCWLLICQRDLKGYGMQGREWIFMVVILVLYFVSGGFREIIGGVLYTAGSVAAGILLFYPELVQCWKSIRQKGDT